MTINNDENNHHPYEQPYPPPPNYIHIYEQPPSHHYEPPLLPPYTGGASTLPPHVNHHGPGICIPLCFVQGLMHSYGLNGHQCDYDEKPPVHKQTPVEYKPAVRVYTKAKIDYSLTIREGQVILAPTNPSDQYQHWIKDDKFGINVIDEEGFSSFALINKATGEAMKHSIGITYPVRLTKYNADRLDKSLLWTQGKSSGDGYRPIRAVDNIHFQLDACEGDLGGVRDGTRIIIWERNNGDNQKWTMAYY